MRLLVGVLTLIILGSGLTSSYAAQPKKPVRNVVRRAPLAIQRKPAPPKSADPAQDLLELIQGTVAPETWEINGGRGTIHYFGLSQAMIVTAPGTDSTNLIELLGERHGN
jgi:hypothetical protein